MKRKFILLPIALTALTPMVSMVGCGNDLATEIKVSNYKSAAKGDAEYYFLHSDKISLKKNKHYVFKIDFANVPTQELEKPNSLQRYWISTDFLTALLVEGKWTPIKFTIDGFSNFEKVESYEDMPEGKYYISEFDEKQEIFVKYSIDFNSQIQLDLKLDRDVENIYFIYLIDIAV